jgi:hypothetical protein
MTSPLPDDRLQKPSSIHRHIGQRPILAAGTLTATWPCSSGPLMARVVADYV